MSDSPRGLPGRSDDPSTQRALAELNRRKVDKSELVVSGSRGGNAALASLLSQLERLGLLDDQTTA